MIASFENLFRLGFSTSQVQLLLFAQISEASTDSMSESAKSLGNELRFDFSRTHSFERSVTGSWNLRTVSRIFLNPSLSHTLEERVFLPGIYRISFFGYIERHLKNSNFPPHFQTSKFICMCIHVKIHLCIPLRKKVPRYQVDFASWWSCRSKGSATQKKGGGKIPGEKGGKTCRVAEWRFFFVKPFFFFSFFLKKVCATELLGDSTQIFCNFLFLNLFCGVLILVHFSRFEREIYLFLEEILGMIFTGSTGDRKSKLNARTNGVP